MQALPALRPLVLVVKALLKDAGLNDAGSGGLSSYGLINMVRTHWHVMASTWYQHGTLLK
jgi:non-canonical poly(A) RNA polymerase PAPD5/7